MSRSLRNDRHGVASTVATLFTLLIVLVFINLALLAPLPNRQYDAEWETSHKVLESFGQLRSFLAGPQVEGSEYTIPIPLGTYPASPLGATNPGTLALNVSEAGPSFSFRFVPNFFRANVAKIDQDVILLMDSSGSMQWNDPQRLRISGAKEYIGQLTRPDRVAIVDFDSVARFTLANVGGPVMHLYSVGHNGFPDYAQAQSELDTIDANGGTNFGDAIRIANDEFRSYGDPKHAKVMILLTDGQNNFPWQNALALSEAQRAKALNVTIYTIGLGSEPDANLLSQIATTTGGTYYPAPDASSIRWIYLELSHRYTSAFQCGSFASTDGSLGSLSLSLVNQRYPSQTIRMEAGGIAIVQQDGTFLKEGFPFEYGPSKGKGASTLTVVAPTFLGPPVSTSGVGYEIVQVRVTANDVVDQPIVHVDLGQEAQAVGNISTSVQYWADRGAATQPAASAVRAPLNDAQNATTKAAAQASAGQIAAAKFSVDHAQAQLSAAISEADRQVTAKQMQAWLGAQTKDDARLEACRLDQWKNWYDGVTMTMTTKAAAGWARWFDATFRPIHALIDIGVSGDRLSVSFHALDRFVLERRILDVRFGG